MLGAVRKRNCTSAQRIFPGHLLGPGNQADVVRYQNTAAVHGLVALGCSSLPKATLIVAVPLGSYAGIGVGSSLPVTLLPKPYNFPVLHGCK